MILGSTDGSMDQMIDPLMDQRNWFTDGSMDRPTDWFTDQLKMTYSVMRRVK